MDGLFHGKPYEQMDDLGVTGDYHYFWKHPYANHWGRQGRDGSCRCMATWCDVYDSGMRPRHPVPLNTWFDSYCYMCQGLNSHYFHIIGDGHQPNSRGLYTHYKDSY